jgi:eukaryotic-like serine/threonine-protein kinase
VHPVASNKPSGTITAQDPPPGKKVPEGTKVRINVSKGPTPVLVPDVRGQPIASATSTLQGVGFNVSVTYVNSNQPQNTVTDQTPAGGNTAAKGSAINLSVSNGPSQLQVPTVTGLDYGAATQTLQNSNFRSRIVYVTVSDPNSDGIVQSQSPQGGTMAKPGSVVTLNVGRFPSGTTSTTTTTTTTPTP